MERSLPAVLLVDDEAALHELLARTAAADSFRLIDAWSPVEAVGLIKKEKPDVILLDMLYRNHPGGGSLVRMIREVAKAGGLEPAIYTLSGVYKTVEDYIDLYRQGADGVFAKPIDLERLRQAIAIATAPLDPALAPQEAARRAEGAATARRPAGANVLLVDDERETLDLLAMHFVDKGFSPYGVESPEIALIEAHKLRPDAVVVDMDFGHGDMSGLDLVKILRASPRTAGIPVCVFSGQERSGGRDAACRQLGADYIVKGEQGWEAVPVAVKGRLQGRPPRD